MTTSVPERAEKARAYMEAQRIRTSEALAVAMHEHVCGSWEAAGFEVKEGFREAGRAAYDALAAQGWDLFAFPDGGWGLVT